MCKGHSLFLLSWLALSGCGGAYSEVDSDVPAETLTDAGPDKPPDDAPTNSPEQSPADPPASATETESPAEQSAPLRIDVTIAAADFDQLYAAPHDRNFEPKVNVAFDGANYANAEMEVHGGHARDLPKLSFRLKFSAAQPLLTDAFSRNDSEEHRRVVLQASWVDPTYARNFFTLV